MIWISGLFFILKLQKSVKTLKALQSEREKPQKNILMAHLEFKMYKFQIQNDKIQKIILLHVTSKIQMYKMYKNKKLFFFYFL